VDQSAAQLIFLAGLGAFALAGWLAFHFQRRRDHVNRVWRGFAKRFGARFVPPDRTRFGETPLRLLARTGGANVTIEVAGLHQPTGASTTVSAQVPGSDGFQLYVSPEGAATAVSRLLGFPDIELGDPAFDERFEVQANNPDLASAWVGDEVRRKMLGCQGYSFTIVGGEARAVRQGIELSPFQLEKAIEVVLCLTRGGLDLLRGVRVFAAHIGGVVSARSEHWEPEGKVLTVLDRQGVQILIDAVVRSQKQPRTSRVWTRLRARTLEPVEIEYVVHGHKDVEPPPELARLPVVDIGDTTFTCGYTPMCADEAGMREVVPATVRSRILGLRPALIVNDGKEVTLLLSGIVLEGATIVAAVDLAADLASIRARGPYR
jgi:hypothetical protein